MSTSFILLDRAAKPHMVSFKGNELNFSTLASAGGTGLSTVAHAHPGTLRDGHGGVTLEKLSRAILKLVCWGRSDRDTWMRLFRAPPDLCFRHHP